MPARRIIYALADSPRFTGWISRHGMRWGFARRFIAGESLEEALAAVRELNAKDLYTTLDYLGESVTDEAATRAAAQTYCKILDTIAETQVGASVSMKLSQLGQEIGDDLVSENLHVILTKAAELDNFVRIDIEDSSTTERTMNTMKQVRAEFTNVGVAVQSYLRRSEQDIRELNVIDAQVRLCKGAYKEPADVAYQKKSEVDESYKRLASMLLDDGNYPAFATHDPRMIEHVIEYAERNSIGADRYEFQMLYGIRRDEQVNLVKSGYGMRVYVPYGEQWCPYFMRRIAERPANAMFVMRAMVKG
jgi:proline dehydrogenase